ncbi:unnamed protein product [Rotaria sp. Silwood1]|nr:unnamed protein product [Rotaria sp. Silwood1]
MFNEMPSIFYKNSTLCNSYIRMLMKFSDISNAENVFLEMNTKDIITYGIMMQGLLENKLYEKALNIFKQMPFKPNEIILIILFKICSEFTNEQTFQLAKNMFNEMPKIFYEKLSLINSYIHMLMKFGEISDSEKLFFLIENKDTTSYTVMMNGYNMNNKPEECLKIFKQMQEKNIVADEITYIIILNACSQIGLLSIYEPIVNKIPSNLLKHHRLQAILIDMWGKVGHVDKALKIFEHIEKPDVMIYTAMINAFGLNGKGHEAIDLYRQMPIDIQNEFTHISVLNACSHSGLISEAQSIFNNIQVKTKRITTVMVDCMSRMFMFDEAQKIIDDFELSHPPGFVMYMALLSAARNHRNSIISEKIYNRMKNLFPQKKQGLIAASVLLSNTYLSIGEDEKAKEIRFKRLSEIGKNKIVGITWTEVNGEVVQFKAHDHSHPRSKEIYAEITRISTELKENGHQYDSKWITREINDNESIESVLCGHSEKLAIAYNFIQQPIPNIIHATKNLRICGDCHSAIKLIVKIRQRPIIIRDANRFHHFDINGQCSCQDHF